MIYSLTSKKPILQLTFVLIFIINYQNVFANTIDSTFAIAYQQLNTNFDSAVAIVQDLENQISTKTSKEQGTFHNQAAQFYASTGNFELEAKQWNKIADFLPKNSDTLNTITYRKGRAYLNMGNWESAYEAFELCKAYGESKNDKKLIAAAYDGIATVLGNQGQYEKAIANYLKAIRILEKIQNVQNLAQVHSNLAVLYNQMQEVDKAFEQRQKAYDLSLLTNNDYGIHKALFGLGSSYNEIGEPDSALILLKQVETYFETNFNPRFLNGTYTEIGRAYSELNDHKKAKAYFSKSIALLRQGGMQFQLAGTLINYGQILTKNKLYTEAIISCQEALQLSEALKAPDLKAAVCECLYTNFKLNQQADSALYYLETLLALEDSISNVEVQKAVLKEELESTYNKEKDNIISEATSEINQIASKRNWWITGFAGLLVILLGFYFVYRQKKKVHESIDREKKYLDNLLHNLVHEFRTPLTLIKGPTEELLKNDGSNNLLKMINKNSDQMLVLINQILDFAKIKAGRLELFEQPTHLDLFYKDSIELFKPIANHKNIEITLKNETALSTILVDSDKLFKILSNLLSNAIKYSESSTTVSIHSKLENNELTIVVKDEGIGISEEDQKKVFDKFYQADATITRKGEGTGLGLAFTRELVNLMKGSITLTSQIGKGTTITVRLPVNKVNEQKHSVSQTNDSIENTIQSKKAPHQTNEQYKILIIEDNTDMQDFLSQILTTEDYEIHSAYDGEKGVQVATEILPDLIISDVMMPKMDGFQVIQNLKRNDITDHIPIIILTAKVSFDSMIEGLEFGADDYVAKPFKSQELLLRVSNQIKRQEALKEKYNTQSGTEEVKPSHPLIEKIESLTLEDTSIHLSIEELTEKCAMSRSQLHRKLKQLTGLSATEFVTQLRMKHALISIKNSDLTISEIAYKFGYADPAHFSKLFKKQFQQTPSEHRKT